MFAFEIAFKDGVSQPEVILVRRPQALVGSSEFAHVVIDDMQNLPYQLRVIRELGSQFRVKPVGVNSDFNMPEHLEGCYDGYATIDVGAVSLHIYALDGDLAIKPNETPDKAGIRILRQACTHSAPQFPAIVVRGADPMVVSFSPDQPIFIGRSNQCLVRLDSSEVSSKHARMTFESGKFWIEDLGSTNGTFVNGQQVAGRVELQPGTPIIVGRQTSIVGVSNQEELLKASNLDSTAITRPSSQKYPVLLSLSEVARPARLIVPIGGTVSIGRDPSSDMWLGAPHVSRKHCSLTLQKSGALQVSDHSTNGTAYFGGLLSNSATLDCDNKPQVLNFGGDLTVAICFDEAQEALFAESQGAFDTFDRAAPSERSAQPKTNPIGQSSEMKLDSEALHDETILNIGDTIGSIDLGKRGAGSGFLEIVRGLSIFAKLLLVFGCFGGVILVWAVVSLMLSMI